MPKNGLKPPRPSGLREFHFADNLQSGRPEVSTPGAYLIRLRLHISKSASRRGSS